MKEGLSDLKIVCRPADRSKTDFLCQKDHLVASFLSIVGSSVLLSRQDGSRLASQNINMTFVLHSFVNLNPVLCRPIAPYHKQLILKLLSHDSETGKRKARTKRHCGFVNLA